MDFQIVRCSLCDTPKFFVTGAEVPPITACVNLGFFGAIEEPLKTPVPPCANVKDGFFTTGRVQQVTLKASAVRVIEVEVQ